MKKSIIYLLFCFCPLFGLFAEAERHSPCLRIKLLEPESPYRVLIYAQVARPNTWAIRTYFWEQGVSPQEFSPWINLGEDSEFRGNPASIVPGVIPAGIHLERLGQSGDTYYPTFPGFASQVNLSDIHWSRINKGSG